ncbi:MAG: hypothetical protein GXN95_06475 [Methanococci archaeon]|nr:hypothetical protein [Methanococci archaeon]
MKIIIPMRLDKISDEFENCEYFLIFEIKDGEINAVKTVFNDNCGEKIKQKIDAVICKKINEKNYKKFSKKGVIYKAEGDDVDKNISLLLENKLKELYK